MDRSVTQKYWITCEWQDGQNATYIKKIYNDEPELVEGRYFAQDPEVTWVSEDSCQTDMHVLHNFYAVLGEPYTIRIHRMWTPSQLKTT